MTKTKTSDPPECSVCGDEYTLDDGCEDDGLCHECAHSEVERLRADLARVEAERDDLKRAAAVEDRCGSCGDVAVSWVGTELRADLARVTKELDALRDDIKRGLRIGYEVTLEAQTVEEMAADLVRQVTEARKQRDAAVCRGVQAEVQLAALRKLPVSTAFTIESGCTGISASWCPRCGDCTCPRDESGEWTDGQNDQSCPLHSCSSRHCTS